MKCNVSLCDLKQTSFFNSIGYYHKGKAFQRSHGAIQNVLKHFKE
jgi:hypothetical protein